MASLGGDPRGLNSRNTTFEEDWQSMKDGIRWFITSEHPTRWGLAALIGGMIKEMWWDMCNYIDLTDAWVAFLLLAILSLLFMPVAVIASPITYKRRRAAYLRGKIDGKD